jgi:hypothetical protein
MLSDCRKGWVKRDKIAADWLTVRRQRRAPEYSRESVSPVGAIGGTSVFRVTNSRYRYPVFYISRADLHTCSEPALLRRRYSQACGACELQAIIVPQLLLHAWHACILPFSFALTRAMEVLVIETGARSRENFQRLLAPLRPISTVAQFD